MQGYNDTRWSNRHAGQQAQDWFLLRAWTGPGDSKQGFPGAVPAAKSLPTRALREPTGTGSVSELSSVFRGPKSKEVWFRSRERASPSQEMPHPGKMGRGTRTLLLGAILKCWAVYPWDLMRGCGNGGRVGVVGQKGSSQRGHPGQALGPVVPRGGSGEGPPGDSPLHGSQSNAASLWGYGSGWQSKGLLSRHVSKMWGKTHHGKHGSDQVQK